MAYGVVCGMERNDIVQYATPRYSTVRYTAVRCGTLRCGTVITFLN